MPGQSEMLSPAVVNYWRVAPIVRGGLMAAPLAVYGVGFFLSGNFDVGIAIAATGVALFVCAVVWALATPRLRYARFRFDLDSQRLFVASGVIVHREKSIPIDRVQHVDVARGPLERVFGLARVSIFTAGGRTATLHIPGLTPERADALRAAVLRERLEPAELTP